MDSIGQENGMPILPISYLGRDWGSRKGELNVKS